MKSRTNKRSEEEESITTKKVNFVINYQVEFGQKVCIVGNIPELGKEVNAIKLLEIGQWEEFKAIMKWTDGHIWTCTVEISSENYFQYKYVILDLKTKQAVRWEDGINRIADLQLLASQGKKLELVDEWEYYWVTFSIYYPLKDPKNEYMRINGDIPELGTWNKLTGPIRMKKGNEITWLTGEKVRPWELKLRHSTVKTPRRVVYKYSIRNDAEDYTIWEREPSRVIDIQDPEKYHGELGKEAISQWRNVDQVCLVNGFIDKSDANFVGGLSFDQIDQTNIVIGPYPQLEEDLEALAKAGITGVFNVQTEIDFEHRGINWTRMLETYKRLKIKAVHFPIHDFNEVDLKAKLYKAAVELNQLINEEGLNVYVHCTAGMGRAPACVLVYLCLFQGWEPEEADRYVKTFRTVSVPNMRVVKLVVAQYREQAI